MEFGSRNVFESTPGGLRLRPQVDLALPGSGAPWRKCAARAAERRCCGTAALGWHSALAAHFLLSRAEWHCLPWVARGNWGRGTQPATRPARPLPNPRTQTRKIEKRKAQHASRKSAPLLLRPNSSPFPCSAAIPASSAVGPLAAAKIWIEPRRGRGRKKKKKEGRETAGIQAIPCQNRLRYSLAG